MSRRSSSRVLVPRRLTLPIAAMLAAGCSTPPPDASKQQPAAPTAKTAADASASRSLDPASAAARARATEAQLTDDERFGLIHSLMVYVLNAKDFSQKRDPRVPANVPQIAGWVKGVPRLGVPDLLLTDAGLGITNPFSARKDDAATALPSAQALAATFNPALAYESGAILGREARAHGFNVVLGGGMNLARDPRRPA